jgi:hypothetical protein
MTIFTGSDLVQTSNLLVEESVNLEKGKQTKTREKTRNQGKKGQT